MVEMHHGELLSDEYRTMLRKFADRASGASSDISASRRILAAHLSEKIASEGVATLPGFLSASALQNAQAEASKLASIAFVSESSHNVYLLPERDDRFDALHVRNREARTVVASIACDELSAQGALKQLYFGPWGDALLSLLSNVFDKQLFRLEDPLGCLSVNVFRPGMSHAWHFDESEFTVTLSLQHASGGGGVFEFSPPLRHNPSSISSCAEADMDSWLAEEAVERVLRTGHNVRTLDFAAGTLSIFSGTRSLHRVTKVLAGDTRLVAVLCFSSQRNQRNSSDVQEQFWGRNKL